MRSIETKSLVFVDKNDYVRRKTTWLVAIGLTILMVIVAVLTGVLAAKKAREEVEEKYSGLKTNLKTTLKPTESTSSSVTTQSFTSTATPCNGIWCDVRLPRSIVPYNYNLFLKPDVDGLKYSGQQNISFQVIDETEYIIVHIKLLVIDDVKVQDSSQRLLDINKHFSYLPNEYFIIQLKEELTQNSNYTVSLAFHANVSVDILTGFYKSSYKESGRERRLLTTKFQPTDARKAFPCFDEPDLKATFDISIDHGKEYKARSNMPGTTVRLNNARSLTKFNTTVKMSPYLICFIVSQFEYKYEGQSGAGNNVTITIWSRPDELKSTEYAFNTSKSMLTHLENYLRVSYPMPKLDMFAIPDYGSGATEHWGIITYRESRLLFTPGTSSKSNKESTAGIIAHECAHLWFGNLVTCKWWDDLWVQEGMASYLEYTAMNQTHPEWNMPDKFLVIDWKTGMNLDALASSHPISQKVDHPKQIKEIFDSITYNKGSSLFQMLDYFLGKDLFREGLKHYLTVNQYKGATVQDLWQAFTDVTGQNISKIMNTWTHQMGYPVISINKTQSGYFNLTQKHFLLDPQAKVTEPSRYNYEWVIPFTFTTSNNLSKKHVIIINQTSAIINSSASWILGNFMHRGFYRVNYDASVWNQIIEELKRDYTKFLVTDRAGLVDDAFNLARAGQLDYKIALDLLSFVENDTNEIVWKIVLSNLGYLDLVLSSQSIYPTYKDFVSSKIKRMYEKFDDQYLSEACNVGLQKAIDDVKRYFNNWKTNQTAIPADIRSTVYYYSVAYGDKEEWDHVYEKFINETSPIERSKLQSALSATRNIWILERWLKMTLDTSIVRTQDTAYVIRDIASSNPVGKYLVWSFVTENWPAIYNIAKENNFHVAAVTSGLTSQFTTEYDLEQARKLWAQYPEAGTGKKAREQGIEKIEGNIYWLKRNYKTVEQWLTKKMTKV